MSTNNDAKLVFVPSATPPTPPPPLVVQDINDFVAMDFPPREPLLVIAETKTPVLTAQSINQVFAWRGVGKSMLSGGLANALATGSPFLAWMAARPCKVLYVDGEMPDAQIKERMLQLTKVKPTKQRNLTKDASQVIQPGYLRLVTVGQQKGGIPSLDTAVGRTTLENAIGDAEILILDSVSTLCWIETNKEEQWLDFLMWINRLRNERRLCVVFLHHAGKNGTQRGHSRSDDLLDISMKLTRDPDDEAQYCKFRLSWDKIRGERTGFHDLEVSYQNSTWSWQTAEAERLATLAAYLADNPKASDRQIAKDIGEEIGAKSHPTIARLKRKLQKQGCKVVETEIRLEEHAF